MEEPKSDSKQIRLPKKAAKVRNKAPAPVQISAEQLLREAKERDLEILPPPPKQKISDPEELAEYRLKRRKEFEDGIRRNRYAIPTWIKYAKFEENQNELQRARSVFERALDVDHRNITLWLQYAEFEIRNRQVNHARNIWDRAVSILPRANQFWLKYVYMEETLGNIPGARQIFERWMEWEPGEQAWQTYINFEMRYKELDRARQIWQRFLHIHAETKNWIKYAQFEARNGNPTNARQVYERAVEYFGDEHLEEHLLIAFAKFEEQQKEHERARVIYKYGLDHLAKEKCSEIFKFYTQHEKKYGERSGIESVVISRRKAQYEEKLTQNRYDYDTWFDYLRLLENEESIDKEVIREAYEKAIACVPLEEEKRFWRRYVYLWCYYALFEEEHCKDYDRARDVYKMCLNNLIPHKKFTFSKLWVMYAHFEIRRHNLQAARKILGTAIGMCPKDKLFRSYIDLELQLREFDRCRKLYEKFLEFNPENCTTWVKVWLSYAKFEMSTDEGNSVEKARSVYRLANKSLSASEIKEERLLLLEAWKEFEAENGDDSSKAEVDNEMPKKIKKRRKIETEDGTDAGWEEYYDYIFPSDEKNQTNLRLLNIAKKWKEKQAEKSQAMVNEKESQKSIEEVGSEEREIKKEIEDNQDADTDIESTSSEDESSSSSSSENEA
uniref:Crooked neck protein n=1 Tax=Romanomermis culicivorax TaxID=13658 RepID=A0A915KUN6_ROMCU